MGVPILMGVLEISPKSTICPSALSSAYCILSLAGFKLTSPTISLSTMTSKLCVPILTFSPKMILSDTPLSISNSEKTAAPNRTSVVSSKLAFLRMDTSLTLLMPFLLIAVRNPRVDIQSARIDRWR